MGIIKGILKNVVLYLLVWMSGVVTAKIPGLLPPELVERITSGATAEMITVAILAVVVPLLAAGLDGLRRRFRVRLALDLPAGTTEKELAEVEQILRKPSKAQK